MSVDYSEIIKVNRPVLHRAVRPRRPSRHAALPVHESTLRRVQRYPHMSVRQRERTTCLITSFVCCHTNIT